MENQGHGQEIMTVSRQGGRLAAKCEFTWVFCKVAVGWQSAQCIVPGWARMFVPLCRWGLQWASFEFSAQTGQGTGKNSLRWSLGFACVFPLLPALFQALVLPQITAFCPHPVSVTMIRVEPSSLSLPLLWSPPGNRERSDMVQSSHGQLVSHWLADWFYLLTCAFDF